MLRTRRERTLLVSICLFTCSATWHADGHVFLLGFSSLRCLSVASDVESLDTQTDNTDECFTHRSPMVDHEMDYNY